MACSCKGRAQYRYVWVPPGESAESDNVIAYNTEIEAKAKVLRKGGQYIRVSRTG